MEALLFTAVLTLLSSFIVSSVVKWWYRMKISDFGRKINQLPGPRPLPFLGSILEISWNFHRRLYFLQEDLVKKYGDIYRIILGNRVTVYISSPVYIQTLLSSQVHLNKADAYKHFGEWLDDGLFVSTGSKWRARRRLLTPVFHFQILEDSLNVFNEQSRILVGMLANPAINSYGPPPPELPPEHTLPPEILSE